jgi:flagellar basal-body rod modification protein FlgD
MSMQTNSTTNNGAGSGAGAADKVSASAHMSEQRDLFTKLLVAQLRNQDPLSPTDPSAFVNQLSQLSQTESLQSLSQTMSANTSLLQSMQVLAMGAQVGSMLSVETGSVRLDGDKVDGNVVLGGASAATSLTLVGADGKETTITLPPHGPGAQPFTIDPAALHLAPGTYTLKAKAADGTQPQVEVSGRLDSVRMAANGGVLLQVAHLGEVEPAAVAGFNGKAAAASTSN